MFTGLVIDVAAVTKVEKRGDTLFHIATSLPEETFQLGASIACSGACMTVTASGSEKGVSWFEFEASAESLDKTTLKDWQGGTMVNLEASLKLGDAMGGHLVSGHIDGVAEVTGIGSDGDSHPLRFQVPDKFAPYIAEKGSIAIDGVSLTINRVEGASFEVNIIPHTWGATCFQFLEVGDKVNFEVDMLARYVARQLEFRT